MENLRQESIFRATAQVYIIRLTFSTFVAFSLSHCSYPPAVDESPYTTERMLPPISDLKRLELVVQVGHVGGVGSLAFSPDGRYVLSAGSGTVRLWHVATGHQIHVFTTQQVRFSSDSRYILVSANLSENLSRLWRSSGGEVIHFDPTQAISPQSRAIALSPDGRYILSRGEGIYNASTGWKIREFPSSTIATFSPDGRLIVLQRPVNRVKDGWISRPDKNSPKGDLTLWKIATGQQVGVLSGHTQPVTKVVFSPDGRYLLSASRDKTVRLWKLPTGHQVRVLTNNSFGSVAFSPDGRYIVYGSDDRLILQETTTGHQVRVLTNSGFGPIAFSPDGRYLLSVGVDKLMKLWEVATGTLIRIFPGQSSAITSVAFSHDDRYIVSSVQSPNHVLKVWDVSTGKIIHSFGSGQILTQVGSVAFHPTPPGSQLVSGGQLASVVRAQLRLPPGHLILSGDHGFVRLWRAPTGQMIRILSRHTQLVTSLAVSPDGRYILSGSHDRTVRLWDLKTGRQIHVFSGHRDEVELVRFSPDGRHAISIGKAPRYEIRTWDIETGREVPTDPKFQTVHAVYRFLGNSIVALSLDGQYVLARGTDNSLRFLEVTGEEIRAFQGHRLGSGVTPGKEICVFRGHNDRVTCGAFSGDGRYVLSGGMDGTLRLWEIQTGKEVAAFLNSDEDGYITVLPDNYYHASKNELKHVAFRLGHTTFPFEQFDLKFNRPDLVLERLGKVSPETIAAYRRLYQKRLQRMGFTEEMLGADLHVPEVEILSKEIPISTVSKSLTFKIRATDSKYPLDRVNVWINNVPIYGVNGISLRVQQTQSVERDLQVQLANGSNKIQVSALNTKGAESLKETFHIVYNGIPATPDIYLVAIGVSQYQNPRYHLDYAAKDASDLASFNQNEIGKSAHFDEVHVLAITDEQATRENIQNTKAFFEQSKVDDLAILFVAGHGLTDDSLDYYFGTHDVDFANPKDRGLPYEELENLLDGISALQKLFLMDTCFSGEIDKTETEVIVADTTSAQTGGGQVRARAFIDARGFKAKQRLSDSVVQFQQDLFADLRRGTGAVILTSSSGDEYSFESETWKNGVFTYAVLKGLKEKSADNNEDGNISVSELGDYVIEQVQALTNGGQNPTIRRENLESDFWVY